VSFDTGLRAVKITCVTPAGTSHSKFFAHGGSASTYLNKKKQVISIVTLLFKKKDHWGGLLPYDNNTCTNPYLLAAGEF
jgi:hypothetical protein